MGIGIGVAVTAMVVLAVFLVRTEKPQHTGEPTPTPTPSTATTSPPAGPDGQDPEAAVELFVNTLNSGNPSASVKFGAAVELMCGDATPGTKDAIEKVTSAEGNVAHKDFEKVSELVSRARIEGILDGKPAVGQVTVTNRDGAGFCVADFDVS